MRVEFVIISFVKNSGALDALTQLPWRTVWSWVLQQAPCALVAEENKKTMKPRLVNAKSCHNHWIIGTIVLTTGTSHCCCHIFIYLCCLAKTQTPKCLFSGEKANIYENNNNNNN